MSARRLPPPVGSRVDRSRTVSFTFDRRQYAGFKGDTLASALLASGVRIVGRSFKLHRPRGVYSCGIEEPNALMDIGEGTRYSSNVRATVVEITDGLVARSINRWPSLGFDIAAINGWCSPLLPAGFYYKTFKWPHWHWFEPAIRRSAGLGPAPREPDAEAYDEVSIDSQVLVVGGGIAGLAAAAAAAAAGSQVVLVSSAPVLGGIGGRRGDAVVASLVDKCRALGVHTLTRTTAFGVYDHNLVCARESVPAFETGTAGAVRERLWKIRTRHLVLAAGAIERPMVFPDNDRPGVMLAGAAEKYAAAYGVACGSRAVMAVNSDHAYALAAGLRGLGIEIAAIADCRPEAAVRADRSASSGVEVMNDAVIAAVAGARGVRACTVESQSGARRIDCDLILSAGGYAPTVHLHSQAGGKLRWLDESAMFVPDGGPAAVSSVGACA